MTELLEVRDVLKQGDGLAPLLFNLVMEYVLRKATVDRNTTLYYIILQIVGYADDTHVSRMGRTKEAMKQTYEKLKRAATGRLTLNVNKKNNGKIQVQFTY
jgi:hypothetical protein